MADIGLNQQPIRYRSQYWVKIRPELVAVLSSDSAAALVAMFNFLTDNALEDRPKSVPWITISYNKMTDEYFKGWFCRRTLIRGIEKLSQLGVIERRLDDDPRSEGTYLLRRDNLNLILDKFHQNRPSDKLSLGDTKSLAPSDTESLDPSDTLTLDILQDSEETKNKTRNPIVPFEKPEPEEEPKKYRKYEDGADYSGLVKTFLRRWDSAGKGRMKIPRDGPGWKRLVGTIHHYGENVVLDAAADYRRAGGSVYLNDFLDAFIAGEIKPAILAETSGVAALPTLGTVRNGHQPPQAPSSPAELDLVRLWNETVTAGQRCEWPTKQDNANARHLLADPVFVANYQKILAMCQEIHVAGHPKRDYVTFSWLVNGGDKENWKKVLGGGCKWLLRKDSEKPKSAIEKMQEELRLKIEAKKQQKEAGA